MRIAKMIASGVLGGGRAVPWYLAPGIPKSYAEAVYQPIGAASYGASKLNLVNPATHQLVDTGHIPDWSAEKGWIGAGSNLYLISDIVPVYASTYIIRFSDWVSGSLGSISGVGQYYQVGFGFDTSFRFGNGSSKDINMTATFGTVCVSGLRCFVDGVYKTSISDTGLTTSQKIKFLINSLNTDASINTPLNGCVAAAAYYTAVLSDEVVSKLHTLMMALPQ